jgi:RNA polymerase sigma factor (sigma-70 family)
MENYLVNLAHQDLQRVMQVNNRLHMAEPDDSFVLHSYMVLKEAFGHVHLTSECFQVQPFRPVEQIAPTIGWEWFDFAIEHIPEHPYFPRMATKLLPDISTTEREASYEQFIQTPLYNEFYSEIGGSSQMWIGLREGNDLLINMYYRDTPYDEKEVVMLQLIQPHLETAWQNWKRLRRFKTDLDILRESVYQSPEEEAEAARIRRAIDALPQRQREVVELVTAGFDNQQIADELKVSILTVKRHLQNIFQSMDVRHRTELAARWHKAHSVKLY